MTKQVLFNLPARVKLIKSGPLWVAQLVVKTAAGPMCFSAGVDTRLVRKALLKKMRTNGGTVTAGLFDSIKKAASGLAKTVALDKVAALASRAIPTPKNVAMLVPKPLRSVAEKAATSLLARAMGGEANARKALGALKSAAESVDASTKYKQAWRTVKRVHRVMKKGGGVADMAKGVSSALIDESFRSAAPVTSAVNVAESQFSRLPGPLGMAARTAFQTLPGVSQAYALTALQNAWQRGQLFTPGNLVNAAANFAPGPAGQWARAAQPYVGAVYANPTRVTRYPLGYVRGALCPRRLKCSPCASGRSKTKTTLRLPTRLTFASAA